MSFFTPDEKDMCRVAGILEAIAVNSYTVYKGKKVYDYKNGLYDCFVDVYKTMLQRANEFYDDPEDEIEIDRTDYLGEFEKYYAAYANLYNRRFDEDFNPVELFAALGKYLTSILHQMQNISEDIEKDKKYQEVVMLFGQLSQSLLYWLATWGFMNNKNMEETWTCWPWPILEHSKKEKHESKEE